MTKIYFTYRRCWTERWVRQDVSFYNDKQYADYVQAWLVSMVDWENFIPDDRYTKEVSAWTWIIRLRRAWYLQVNDASLVQWAKNKLNNIAKQFDLQIKTSDEMIAWIKDKTNLVEDTVTAGKFLIQEESVWIWSETIPAQYLLID